MTNQDRIQALYDRIDGILERVADNPIYDEKDARSVLSYAQTIKLLTELERKEEEHGKRDRRDG